jgi:hypothetical protein
MDDVFYCFAALKKKFKTEAEQLKKIMQEQSLPLEYTIDVFNNHSAYQFYLIN